jgi:hypothetical protein
MKSGRVNHRNWKHVYHEPFQGWSRCPGGSKHLALEVGGVEEHNRRIETEQHQPRRRKGLAMTFDGMKAGEPLYFPQNFGFGARDESYEAQDRQNCSE